MSITLDDIVLPDRLFWTDRFSWSPLVQRLGRFENGVLLREESQVVAGRPITLVGDDQYAWSTWSIAEQLYEMQQVANAPAMTLTIHGVPYQVIWRFEGGNQSMVVRPLHGPISNPDPDEPYVLAELRFITV